MQSKYLKKALSLFPCLVKVLHHKFAPSDFELTDKLYRGYTRADIDDESQLLQANSIRFPDFSCNWNLFSRPKDIRKRINGKPTDGCYSFPVAIARYNKMATTCHDPLPQMFAHTEIRQLRPNEDIYFEPPPKRDLYKEIDGWSRSKRFNYRQNIVNNHVIELEAER